MPTDPTVATARWVTLTNRVLRRARLMLVPLPTSPKMLREHANISESFHPSRGGLTVKWLRDVAALMERAK